MEKVLAIVLYVAMLIAMAMTSCRVERSVVNRSECVQRGDTAVIIQSRTIETYDATVKRAQGNQ